MGLISVIANFRRKRRLFQNEEKLFIRHSAHRTVVQLKRAIAEGNPEEQVRRKKHLSQMGLKYPNTEKQCDKFLEDIAKWRN